MAELKAGALNQKNTALLKLSMHKQIGAVFKFWKDNISLYFLTSENIRENKWGTSGIRNI